MGELKINYVMKQLVYNPGRTFCSVVEIVLFVAASIVYECS